MLWGRKIGEQKGLNAFCRRSIRPSPKVCNLPKKVTNPGAPVRWAIRVQPIKIVRDAKPAPPIVQRVAFPVGQESEGEKHIKGSLRQEDNDGVLVVHQVT